MLVREKARATNHVGIKGKNGKPKGSSRHNFREFPKNTKEEGASKIDRSLTYMNQYLVLGRFCDYKGLQKIYKASAESFKKQATMFSGDYRYGNLTNSQKIELAVYAKILKDNLNGQHKRNADRRQSCLDKNAIDVLLSSKTMPEESILQIGNKDYCPVSVKQLWSIYQDYVQEHNAKYGKYIKILDATLHVDEPTGTPHVHERKAYIGVNKHGEPCISKDSALAQLGIQRPDLTKNTSRRNNRKQAYTAECRQMWLNICRKHDLNLETEPRVYGDPHGLELTEYKLQQEQAKLNFVRQEIAEQQTEKAKNNKTIIEQEYMIENYKNSWQDVDIAMYVSANLKNEYPDYYGDLVADYWEEQKREVDNIEL